MVVRIERLGTDAIFSAVFSQLPQRSRDLMMSESCDSWQDQLDSAKVVIRQTRSSYGEDNCYL